MGTSLIVGESVGAVVLSSAAGGALGGAVQGAGNEIVVEGNRDSQDTKKAAGRGFKIGAVVGALGGFVVAPKIGTFGVDGAADALTVGAAQGVAAEASTVIDLGLDVYDEFKKPLPSQDDEEPNSE